jgi:hypothetical protein
MRLAGSPEVYQALAQHFVSDEVPEGAAHHMAAEVMAHGPDADTDVDRFFQVFQELLGQGYDERAAEHLAIEIMEKEG